MADPELGRALEPEQILRIPAPYTFCEAIWHPSHPYLATTDRSGAIRLWSIESGTQLNVAYGHRGDRISIKYLTDIFVLYWINHSNGDDVTDLMTAGEDGTVRRWRLLVDNDHPVLCKERSLDLDLSAPIACVHEHISIPIPEIMSKTMSVGWVADRDDIIWTTDQRGRLFEFSRMNGEWDVPTVNKEYTADDDSATAVWTGEFLVTQPNKVSERDEFANLTIYTAEGIDRVPTKQGSHPADAALNVRAIGQTSDFLYVGFDNDLLWLWKLASTARESVSDQPDKVNLAELLRDVEADPVVKSVSLSNGDNPLVAVTTKNRLYILRNDLGLTAAKFGCGTGQCGACTVLIDGQARPSCKLPVGTLQGLSLIHI